MKKGDLLPFAETIVAALLFVSMLFACGKYIDIKINGKSSSLPEIPERDMQILMQMLPDVSVAENHTLAEPVAVGVKADGVRLMAHTKEARESVLDFSRSHVIRCFAGKSTEMEFESNEEAVRYVSELCSNSDYLFFSFYSDIPAAAFLPSLAREYETKDSRLFFNVQNLFLLSDNEQNLYAVAVSSGKKVNILTPDEITHFQPSEYDAYNDIAGFAPYENLSENCLLPVFSQSIEQNNYTVKLAPSVFGMNVDAGWIQKTMEVFGLNKNFSKTFVTRDNSLIDFIDDTNELMFSSDGSIRYNSNGEGLDIYDLLLYNASGSSYTFPDKTLAVKRLFNMLDPDICGKDAKLGITNVYNDKETGELCFELKYFASGVVVTQKQYDAIVRMNGDMITQTSFDALHCERMEKTSPVLPQKYSYLDGEDNVVCHYRLLLPTEDGSNEYGVVFATLTEKSEEDK